MWVGPMDFLNLPSSSSKGQGFFKMRQYLPLAPNKEVSAWDYTWPGGARLPKQLFSHFVSAQIFAQVDANGAAWTNSYNRKNPSATPWPLPDTCKPFLSSALFHLEKLIKRMKIMAKLKSNKTWPVGKRNLDNWKRDIFHFPYRNTALASSPGTTWELKITFSF